MTEFTDRVALQIRVMLAHLRVETEGYVSRCARSLDYEPSRAQSPELRALSEQFVEDLASSALTTTTPSKKRPKASPFIFSASWRPRLNSASWSSRFH